MKSLSKNGENKLINDDWMTKANNSDERTIEYIQSGRNSNCEVWQRRVTYFSLYAQWTQLDEDNEEVKQLKFNLEIPDVVLLFSI